MYLFAVLQICIGCPPLPPPPPPPPPPQCEGYVPSPLWGGAQIFSRGSSELTFILQNCVADYVFFGPDGVPEVYNNRRLTLTVPTRHTDVSLNSTAQARLYVVDVTGIAGYAWYSMNRWKITAFDNGITWSWNNQWFSFNTNLWEDYERLSIGWPYGTRRNVWVGASRGELIYSGGGALPGEIDAWNVHHNYTNALSLPIRSRVMQTSPILGGNPLYSTASDNYTFGGGQNTTGELDVRSIQIGNVWSYLIINNPISNPRITN